MGFRLRKNYGGQDGGQANTMQNLKLVRQGGKSKSSREVSRETMRKRIKDTTQQGGRIKRPEEYETECATKLS